MTKKGTETHRKLLYIYVYVYGVYYIMRSFARKQSGEERPARRKKARKTAGEAQKKRGQPDEQMANK